MVCKMDVIYSRTVIETLVPRLFVGQLNRVLRINNCMNMIFATLSLSVSL